MEQALGLSEVPWNHHFVSTGKYPIAMINYPWESELENKDHIGRLQWSPCKISEFYDKSFLEKNNPRRGYWQGLKRIWTHFCWNGSKIFCQEFQKIQRKIGLHTIFAHRLNQFNFLNSHMTIYSYDQNDPKWPKMPWIWVSSVTAMKMQHSG